jgi:hypothetical protein
VTESGPLFKVGQRAWFAEWSTVVRIDEQVSGGGYWAMTERGSRVFLLDKDLAAIPGDKS